MKKVKKIMILGLFLTSCSNPNNVINTNTPPSPNISSSITSSNPIPSSSISTMPSLVPTSTPSAYENKNAIKKVELYYKIRNTLFYSSDNKIENNRSYDFTLTNYEYYDFQIYAKITYNDGRSEDKDIILDSSNKDIAHLQNDILYIHSKDNKSGFNLIIQDKETKIEIASYKIDLGSSDSIFQRNPSVMLSGKVYDKNNNIINNAKVSIKCLDLAQEYATKYILIEQPKYGEFKLNYIMSGARFEIEVSKEGYKTVTRKFVLKNLSLFQEMNFGGTNEDDKPYALEKL